MPIAQITGRSLILIGGADAEHFLQNLVTTDIDMLEAGEARPGALLTPQGKILFDFLISRDGTAFRLECPALAASDFERRLMLYRLRAKVEISVADHAAVCAGWQFDAAPSGTEWLRDRRFPDDRTAWRSYDHVAADSGEAEWRAYRIATGISESGEDFALGEAFPHDVLFDQTGGVGFRKGCYVGQEVVSRMHHRGTARRRVLIATAQSALPEPGSAVTAAGKAIGSMGGSAGSTGLAMVRIDRAKEAIDTGAPILAGDIEISLSIPRWARFGFPESGTDPEKG